MEAWPAPSRVSCSKSRGKSPRRQLYGRPGACTSARGKTHTCTWTRSSACLQGSPGCGEDLGAQGLLGSEADLISDGSSVVHNVLEAFPLPAPLTTVKVPGHSRGQRTPLCSYFHLKRCRQGNRWPGVCHVPQRALQMTIQKNCPARPIDWPQKRKTTLES